MVSNLPLQGERALGAMGQFRGQRAVWSTAVGGKSPNLRARALHRIAHGVDSEEKHSCLLVIVVSLSPTFIQHKNLRLLKRHTVRRLVANHCQMKIFTCLHDIYDFYKIDAFLKGIVS